MRASGALRDTADNKFHFYLSLRRRAIPGRESNGERESEKRQGEAVMRRREMG